MNVECRVIRGRARAYTTEEVLRISREVHPLLTRSVGRGIASIHAELDIGCLPESGDDLINILPYIRSSEADVGIDDDNCRADWRNSQRRR
jgi:hypothetical protein